ncbi:MAG: MBL fold metallo-hydrolase [Candidatus Helarchaeota archaeon]
MEQNSFFLKASKPMWPASCNIFVIKDDKGLVLIEVGCGLRRFIRKFFKKLEQLNFKLVDVNTIVISHAHPDHMGAMDAIYEKIHPKDIKIMINKLEKPNALNIKLLNDTFDIHNLRKYYTNSELENRFGGKVDIIHNFRSQCTMSQLPEDAYIRTFKNNDILELGEFKFLAITTSGHSPGHTSFYEINKKFLLSGDLIGEHGVAWYSPSSGGCVEYLSSLDKIEQHSISYIYPAHGDKIIDVKKRIRGIRSNINRKDQRILELLKERPQTVLSLAKILYKNKYMQIFPGIAIVESHLIKLEQENKIEKDNNIFRKVK